MEWYRKEILATGGMEYEETGRGGGSNLADECLALCCFGLILLCKNELINPYKS